MGLKEILFSSSRGAGERQRKRTGKEGEEAEEEGRERQKEREGKGGKRKGREARGENRKVKEKNILRHSLSSKKLGE